MGVLETLSQGEKDMFRKLTFVLYAITLTLGLRTSLRAQEIPAQRYVNAQLPWQPPVLDSTGRLLAWYHPQQRLGYDHVVRLAWNLLEHMPDDQRTGLPAYLSYAVFNPQTLQGSLHGSAQNNPASMFGQFVDSVVGWYPYSGDLAAVAMVRRMLDYMLAHGTSPADWDWAQVPFPVGCNGAKDYGRCMTDLPADYYGGIEVDKLGELGIGYVLFYEMTGDHKYLEAGIHCADALAKHVRDGDADHTPWPFRVEGRTGHAVGGNIHRGRDEYGGMIVAPVRLFAELIRIHEGDVPAYQKARKLAWNWIRDYPLNPHSQVYGKWSCYFEDVPYDPEDVNQASPTMTAYYILSQPDPSAVDPTWKEDVGHLIDWVRRTLGVGPFLGAWAVNEQGHREGGWGTVTERTWCCSRAGLASDTSRWAAINAMYYERTGDVQAREDAFRSLNYATYFANTRGLVACCGVDYGAEHAYWIDDGYGDYIRNFMWAMAAVPAFAPKGQNHLLGSTSVVQNVKYGEGNLDYRTFDQKATEVLRLHFKPRQVYAGKSQLHQVENLSQEGYTVKALEGGDYVVRVHHITSNEIRVQW
jgi:hypothetical protein